MPETPPAIPWGYIEVPHDQARRGDMWWSSERKTLVRWNRRDAAVGTQLLRQVNRERPIRFPDAQVSAILDGWNLETRRPVVLPAWARPGTLSFSEEQDGWPSVVAKSSGCLARVPCPYGKAGDRLWVREAWYCDDYRCQRGPYLEPPDLDPDQMYYAAEYGRDFRFEDGERCPWRPSIHMPRWASRILLEVTEVRVERAWVVAFKVVPRTKHYGGTAAPQDA